MREHFKKEKEKRKECGIKVGTQELTMAKSLLRARNTSCYFKFMLFSICL